ncbi:MAG: RNA-binding protein [Gammaproteobacteria bacterium]|jgi:RNA-binding protein
MINKQQLKYLRSLAHDRKPIIWIGQHGLTDNVKEEINIALEHHELIKIKLRVGDRETRDKVCDAICAGSKAALIQKIGNTVTIYRHNDEAPVIQFSKKALSTS